MITKTLNDYMTELLSKVTHTVEGYEVKELKWNERDNIIIGRVKDPIVGRPEFHDGFVVCTWRKNGSLNQRYGGQQRQDLYLKLTSF